jgi:hypothetical protein
LPSIIAFSGLSVTSIQLALSPATSPSGIRLEFRRNGVEDVIAFSAARERLGVFKMADSESSTPIY